MPGTLEMLVLKTLSLEAPVVETGGGKNGVGAMSPTPWGGATVLPISTMHNGMMGGEGLTLATKIAILNANYIAKRLDEHDPVLYKGTKRWVRGGWRTSAA